MVRKAAQFFASQGAEVVEDRPEGIERTYDLHWKIFFLFGGAEKRAQECFSDLSAKDISPLRRQFEQQIADCNLSVPEIGARFKEIAILRANVYQFLNKYDLIICPPCATVAKPHGKCLTEVKDFTYTMLYNNTGSPATVVRCGTSQNGLPIGIQVVSNLWRDHVSLAAAKALEIEFGGWQLPQDS